MNRQVKGLLYFFMCDIRHVFVIFWSILIASIALSICISYFLLGADSVRFYFSLSFATYFFCFFLGFITVKESIPFALKIGATRKNLFTAIGLFFLGTAVMKAIIASVLQSVIVAFNELVGISSYQLIHVSQFLSDTWFNRIVIDTAVMFFVLALTFMFGLLFYRTGLVGGGSVVALLVVLLLLGIAQGWFTDFIYELVLDLDFKFFYQLFGMGILLYGLSYFFTRKITIIKVK